MPKVPKCSQCRGHAILAKKKTITNQSSAKMITVIQLSLPNHEGGTRIKIQKKRTYKNLTRPKQPHRKTLIKFRQTCINKYKPGQTKITISQTSILPKNQKQANPRVISSRERMSYEMHFECKSNLFILNVKLDKFIFAKENPCCIKKSQIRMNGVL